MRTVVGVLRGGPSSEYEVSLQTGASVLEALDKEKYEPRDIFISRSGEWHLHGIALSPERALREVDVVLNALHGEFGEDGKVQRILEALAVPYTGSDAAASALAFNKQRTKKTADALGVKVAHGIVVDSKKITDLERTALNIFRSLPHPVVVKPITGGSSVGTAVAPSFHALQFALEHAFAVAPKAVVEEYIPGREATVGVVENFRNQKSYALFPVEIVPPQGSPFFDYEAKYSGKTLERVPGNFTPEEKKQLAALATTVHEGLSLRHYSRSDFIVSPRGIYFLEVNTLPGLTQESLLPKALRAVGARLSDFLDHIIALAKTKKRNA